PCSIRTNRSLSRNNTAHGTPATFGLSILIRGALTRSSIKTPLRRGGESMDPITSDLLDKLRKTQARQALVLALIKGQRTSSEPNEMMRTAAETVGRYLQADRAGFFEMRDDTVVFSGGWSNGRIELLTGEFPAQGIGTDLKEADAGTASLIRVPIIRKGAWHAGFYVGHSEVRYWSEDEVALVRDVGEQTWDSVECARAENALRKSEERLTLGLEAGSGVGTWDWDVAADRVYSDARFARLFSVDPAKAAAGVPVGDFIDGIHPEDRERVSQRIQQTLETGEYFSEEYRVVSEDGLGRWIYAQGRCHRDANGKAVRFPGVAIDITRRKESEVDLRRQWHKFDTALSHTPDFTYIFDLEGRFTYSNRPLLLLLQRTLDEVAGKNFHDLNYPPELADRLQRQIQEVIRTKQPVRDQTPFTGPGGEPGVYEYIFVPVLSESGEVEGVAGSTRNITERIKAEQLVKDDRRRWRDLLLQAPAAIALVHGPRHVLEWVNDGYARLVGRSSGALIGKPIVEALPEMAGQIYVGLLDGVFQTGQPFLGYESLVRLGPNPGALNDYYVNFVYQPRRNAAGDIDGIFAHITDVTDMVLARKRIEESEQRFRNLADSMPHIAWTALPDGRPDYHNARWYDFAGCDPALDRERSWNSTLHPEDAPRAREAWAACLKSGDPFQIEARLRDRHSNSWRWHFCRAIAVRDSAGNVSKWFGTCTDIDEQKQSQQALQQTQKLESIGLLAGGVAHDFNNLLVGIMGGASFALDSIPPMHPAHAMLQSVVDASERAAHLTRQMLAYAGKGKFIIEYLDLSTLVLQTAPLVSASIPKSVQVKLRLDDRLPSVETDRGQI
ncbi:MAG TPA: PAS domain-containing protein, partial [Bryobacteraceae bacterium]|nr:PAS domain-containing protein [Bryobacteraceae bacterium]